MNHFDKDIKKKIANEQIEIPISVKNRIEQTLAILPEKPTRIKPIHIFPCIATAVACFVFVVFFLLPNISAA